MNCRQVEPLLSDLLERSLSDREARLVAAHLDACRACRRRRDEFVALGAELRGLTDLLPPPHLAHRAIDRWAAEGIAPSPAPRRWRFRGIVGLAPLGAATCAAAALAVLGLALARQAHRGQTRAPAPQIVYGLPLPPAPAAPVMGRGRPPRNEAADSWSAPLPPAKGEVRPGDLRTAKNLAVPVLPDGGTPSELRNLVPFGPSPRLNTNTPERIGDLPWLNGSDPVRNVKPWAPVPRDEWDEIEAKVRRNVHVRDDFVQVAFTRIAGNSDRAVVAAVEQYKREAAIIDARLFHEVTLAQKATPLSELCDHLRSETGIQLAAGSSVADEKVTLFCHKLPLREVMRQLSRPFGYTWLRSGTPGQFKYELVQDLRSQLEEEALRNRDRNEALLALDREMNQYHRYVALSPDEARERAKTAPPAEKRLLERYAGAAWGPAQIYFRLSPGDLAALRAGQRLTYSAAPLPGEQSLPSDLARGVLQSLRDHRVRMSGSNIQVQEAKAAPDGVPPADFPDAGAKITLQMDQSDLGQFRLVAGSGIVFGGPSGGHRHWLDEEELAVGVSPAVRNPMNALANKPLASDQALQHRVTVRPQASCRPSPPPLKGGAGGEVTPEVRVSTADVLEALHRAADMPVVADSYTRLYPQEAVSVRDRPLFETLNRLADAMHMHWKKEGNWLRFRSASFFQDRLKEVPNRLLTRWAASRQQHGALTLEDMIEIAQLSDPQLDAAGTSEGAKLCFGLAEWDLARKSSLRPHLRFLAGLTPAQRQEAQSANGLAFIRLSLPQQQQFISLALGRAADRVQSLEGLTGATLRIDYSLPGGYEWRVPDSAGGAPWRILQPSPVRERTRQAALQAARRINANAAEAQIVPTDLSLTVLFTPGPNARLSPGGVLATPVRTASFPMSPLAP